MKRGLVKGFAETELDEVSVKKDLYENIRHVPQTAKPMGIRMENKTPNPEDIE